MEPAAKQVRLRFEALKRASPFPVVLKTMKGRYYVYRHTTKWDKEQKKVRSTEEYLGRILENGDFVKKTSGYKDAVEQAREVIEAIGGRVILPEIANIGRVQNADKVDKELLMTLSMNARADLSFAAKRLGIPHSTVYGKVKQLELKYGLGYTLELDIGKLGYTSYLILVKFLGSSPPTVELKRLLENEPKVELAATTTGKYDLIIFALAESSQDIAYLGGRIMQNEVLLKYKSKTYITDFHNTYGFVPVRNKFIEAMKDKVLKREHAVLKALNKDASAKFTDIDRESGFDIGRSKYSYNKLKESGLIIRPTLTMARAPMKYTAILLAEINDWNVFSRNRDNIREMIIEGNNGITNRCVLVGDIGIPMSGMFVLPIADDGELDTVRSRMLRYSFGAKLSSLIITDVLVGRLPYRLFDNSYSRQYLSLVKEGKLKSGSRTDYEKTGRAKTKVKNDYIIIENEERETEL